MHCSIAPAVIVNMPCLYSPCIQYKKLILHAVDNINIGLSQRGFLLRGCGADAAGAVVSCTACCALRLADITDSVMAALRVAGLVRAFPRMIVEHVRAGG